MTHKLTLLALTTVLASAALAAPAHAATAHPATVHPATVGCYYRYNANGVYILAGPWQWPAYGEGYSGQEFFSYPNTTAYAGGQWWVKGTDEATGVSGWSASQYLTTVSCHNY